MSVQTERAFLLINRSGDKTSGSLKEEWCDDGEYRYFVEWDITDKLGWRAIKKLKDTLDIGRDMYDTIDTFEGFVVLTEKKLTNFIMT